MAVAVPSDEDISVTPHKQFPRRTNRTYVHRQLGTTRNTHVLGKYPTPLNPHHDRLIDSVRQPRRIHERTVHSVHENHAYTPDANNQHSIRTIQTQYTRLATRRDDHANTTPSKPILYGIPFQQDEVLTPLNTSANHPSYKQTD